MTSNSILGMTNGNRNKTGTRNNWNNRNKQETKRNKLKQNFETRIETKGVSICSGTKKSKQNKTKGKINRNKLKQNTIETELKQIPCVSILFQLFRLFQSFVCKHQGKWIETNWNSPCLFRLFLFKKSESQFLLRTISRFSLIFEDF